MRPKTIVYFEWIILGTVLLGIFDPDRSIAQSYIIILLYAFVLFATLTLLVLRRRSKIAMWVLIAFGLLGISLAVWNMIQGRYIIAALQSSGQVVAYVLLFTPPARRWMNREDEKLGEVFH